MSHRIKLLEVDLEQCDACSCGGKCRHEFEVDPISPGRKLCLKCDVEMIHPIDCEGDDFDAWNAGRLYGKRTPIRQPRCPAKTVKGEQCVHPCQLMKDLCRRHWKVSQTTRCQHTLKTGRPCGKLCRGEDTLCFRHLKPRGVRLNAPKHSPQRFVASAPTLRSVSPNAS